MASSSITKQAPVNHQGPVSIIPSNPIRSSGFYTLLYKELLRFWKVSFQTLVAPLLTTLLYLLIFSHVMRGKVEMFPGVAYANFLIPGLMMMAMIQNAFANTSSSLTQSKITGNIVFVLLPPLSHLEIFAAYVCAGIVRGVLVGVGIWLATMWIYPTTPQHPFWILAFALCATAFAGALGVIAGIWADKFDQMAAFQNFIITPLTFLAGVFYSIHSLPAFWQKLSHLNPFFYMTDGFRYGFFDHADVSPWVSLAFVAASALALSLVAVEMLRRGYKLRH
jgi:ABC-2 type transport system permease protein